MRRVPKRAPDSSSPPDLPATVPEPAPGPMAQIMGDAMAAYSQSRWQVLVPPVGGGLPYVGFYTGRGSRAADISRALGNCSYGTPYVRAEGQYYPWRHCGFTLLGVHQYWAASDQRYQPVAAWDRDPGKRQYGARWISETVSCVLVVVPFGGPLPEDLAPALATLSTFRGAQCRGVLKHHAEVVRVNGDSPDAAKWQRENGAIVSALLPPFRVVSKLDPQTGTIKHGERAGDPYLRVESSQHLPDAQVIAALGEWYQAPECAEELQRVLEEFARRKAEIEKLIAATAAKEGEAPKDEDLPF